MDVVRHYDVDGIHLDFIRYGGDGKTVGHWGYNPVSVARYDARYGVAGKPRWNDARWRAWRRAQVTALVRRVYVSATALKPKLIVSAATICWGDAPASDAEYEAKSASYTEVFAPWRDWMREGILDLNCPMTYFWAAKSLPKWRGWNLFAKDRQYGHLVAFGVAAYLNPVGETLAMVRDTRAATRAGHRAAGAVVYCWDTPTGVGGREVEGGTALFEALPNVFKRDVPPPAMPWKDMPTKGALMGTLLAGDGLTPVDGAKVTATRHDGNVHRAAESDGNGWFGFAGLPGGTYHVRAVWPGGTYETDLRVHPGATVQTLGLEGGAAPVAPKVAGVGGGAGGARGAAGRPGDERLGPARGPLLRRGRPGADAGAGGGAPPHPADGDGGPGRRGGDPAPHGGRNRDAGRRGARGGHGHRAGGSRRRLSGKRVGQPHARRAGRARTGRARRRERRRRSRPGPRALEAIGRRRGQSGG